MHDPTAVPGLRKSPGVTTITNHLLMIHPSDEGRVQVENGVRQFQIRCISSTWEKLDETGTTRRRLAVVWPLRHQTRPELPSRTLAELVQRTPVVAMLRATDYELLERYHHANLWVCRDQGRPEELERMLGWLLAQRWG